MAVRRIAALLAVTAFLAACLPASAQVPPLPTGPPTGPTLPPAPGAASVEVRAAAQSLQVSLDKAGTTQVTVTNTANPTGVDAFDRPRLVVLGLSDAPTGWTGHLSRTEFQLKPGESGKADLTVAVAGSAQADKASVTVTARLYPIGVNSVPVAGPQADPEATAATVVEAVRADSVTRDVLETVGSYIWVVLLGLVAAVVLALSILASNRRVAVRLSSPEAEQPVAAGGRAAFPLRVHNITRQADTVFLRAHPLPEGWAAYLPTPQVDLEPGQQEEVSVVVIAPKEAGEGAQQAVDVTATSSLAPRRPATMRFEAKVAPKKRGGASASASASA